MENIEEIKDKIEEKIEDTIDLFMDDYINKFAQLHIYSRKYRLEKKLKYQMDFLRFLKNIIFEKLNFGLSIFHKNFKDELRITIKDFLVHNPDGSLWNEKDLTDYLLRTLFKLRIDK